MWSWPTPGSLDAWKNGKDSISMRMSNVECALALQMRPRDSEKIRVLYALNRLRVNGNSSKKSSLLSILGVDRASHIKCYNRHQKTDDRRPMRLLIKRVRRMHHPTTFSN